MHELAVCQSIITQVERIAAEHCAIAVNSISVQLGPLSGVEAALLEQAFPIARAVSPVAQNAQLKLQTLPLRIRCLSCGQESDVKPNKLLCSHCGDWQTQVISGDEMLLAQLELEYPDAEEPQHV